MTDPHGGNIWKLARETGKAPDTICDFSANLNPLGPPEWLRTCLSKEVSSLCHYPDPHCTRLITAAAARFAVKPACVIAGNGSTEILYVLPRAVSATRAKIPVPSYADYETAASLGGLPIEKFALRKEDGFALNLDELVRWIAPGDLVMLGQPNNPTGGLSETQALRELAQSHPRATFVIDESFLFFVEGASSLTQERPDNVIVLLSLTKFYAIPGLRLGLAVAAPNIIANIRRLLPPWSVNTLAQAVGVEALADEAYAAKTRAFVRDERLWLWSQLADIPGLTVYPGSANFLLIRMDPACGDADHLAAKLLTSGIAIRECANFAGLDASYFRVAVRTRPENIRLCQALTLALGCAQGLFV